jgi:hypothetical protein
VERAARSSAPPREETSRISKELTCKKKVALNLDGSVYNSPRPGRQAPPERPGMVAEFEAEPRDRPGNYPPRKTGQLALRFTRDSRA